MSVNVTVKDTSEVKIYDGWYIVKQDDDSEELAKVVQIRGEYYVIYTDDGFDLAKNVMVIRRVENLEITEK